MPTATCLPAYAPGCLLEKQAEYDAFMQEYFDFGSLFDKSEADLIAMNEKFGEYYIEIIDPEALAQESDLPEQGRPGGWMVWAQYISMGQRHDYSKALNDVTVPVLVIHGADDLQSESASRLYAEAFPNSEFVVIQNASHFSMEQQPEQFAQHRWRFHFKFEVSIYALGGVLAAGSIFGSKF